jgi:hypothetical protein
VARDPILDRPPRPDGPPIRCQYCQAQFITETARDNHEQTCSNNPNRG